MEQFPDKYVDELGEAIPPLGGGWGQLIARVDEFVQEVRRAAYSCVGAFLSRRCD